MSEAEILTRREGFLGRIVLNRPAALNALDLAMIEAIDQALSAWERDPDVRCILMEGAGSKGLCAGGDVRAMRRSVLDGAPDRADHYLASEYRLNARIAAFAKPYVAFMDGIVMGGGVGVSGHGSHRVVTERTRLAMPEVAIGFLPDVGGTWILSRAPDEMGIHAGLTGGSLTAFDALECGFADWHVPSATLEPLADRLRDCTDAASVTHAITDLATPAERKGFATDRDWISQCYAGSDVATILERLRSSGNPAAQHAADTIAAVCPMSVCVTLHALRAAPGLGALQACLDMERRFGRRLLRRPDFAEGVRAVLVDKDRKPRWQPDEISRVDPAELARIVAD